MVDSDDIARRAARDVSRLLDRRGLHELVALARRVRQEARSLSGAMVLPQVTEPDMAGCTLRQRDRTAQQRTANRPVDDRYSR